MGFSRKQIGTYYFIRGKLKKFLGGKCAKCDESELNNLEIDHIHSDGDKHRKRFLCNKVAYYINMLNDPQALQKYQLLCKVCHKEKTAQERANKSAMRRMKLVPTLILAWAATAAFAGITVTKPAQNAKVSSPFEVVATSATCNSKPVTYMEYAVDSTTATTKVDGQKLDVQVTATSGAHVVHLYSFNASGHKCILHLPVTVAAPPPPPVVAIPAFSVPAGTYTTPQTLTLTDATPGASIAYSLDGSAPTVTYSAPLVVSGSETVKAVGFELGYTNSPVASVAYVITAAPSGPVIPPTAKVNTDIQALPSGSGGGFWHWNHDPATPGASTGTSAIVATPSLDGKARQYSSNFTSSGGEIYSVSYDHDGTSHNFVYDVYVYIKSGSVLSNLEMDSNQVMSNGQLFIYGFQCAGTSGVWEFGGPWVKSTAPCNPNNWTKDTWHHIQISYSRDDAGIAYYHSVWLDGVEAKIDGQQHSLRATKWGANIIQTQFQIDGKGASGSSVLYADKMTVYHW